MSTRGYFIGQIVDELASLSHQISIRAELGYTDLHRMIEDFIKDILNVVLDKSALENLNETRSNAPGLDLGDKVNRRAFQVTSRATSKKVGETLATVVRHRLDQVYDEIRIVVVGSKQSQYTVAPSLLAQLKFEPDYDIWDISDLCRRSVGLPIEKLHHLHTLVSGEMRRIRIELERPDEDGKFSSSFDGLVESKPVVVATDGTAFFNNDSTDGLLVTLQQTQDDLNEWSARLADLPRFTREVYAYMFSIAEDPERPGDAGLGVNIDLLEASIRYQGLERELRLLETKQFIYVDRDEPPPRGQSPFYHLQTPGVRQKDFQEALMYFAQDHMNSLRAAIVSLDFSMFGPAPAALASPNVVSNPTTTD